MKLNLKKILAAVMGLLLLFSLVGCHTPFDEGLPRVKTPVTPTEPTGTLLRGAVPEETQTIDVQPTSVPVKEAAPAPEGYIGIEKAKELVFAQLGLTEATFTKAEYDRYDGVYELEFYHDGIEYEYEVDAVSGRVVETDFEREGNRTGTEGGGYIGADAAKKLVLDHLGLIENDVMYLRCELDDGYYEVEFTYNGMEYDYSVNARTGDLRETGREPADPYDDWDEDDNDSWTANPSPALIGSDTAMQLVLNYFGLTANDVTRLRCELDDGYYEVEFTYDGIEYEYAVNAVTGEFFETDREYADFDD